MWGVSDEFLTTAAYVGGAVLLVNDGLTDGILCASGWDGVPCPGGVVPGLVWRW